MVDVRHFKNRTEAGLLLARRLDAYAHRPDAIVLALPRGGVPVGFAIARRLGIALDVLLVRKLGMPGHEEFAMGAVGSGGVRVLQPGAKPVRRGGDWVLKTAGGALPLSAGEAEAAGWVLSRPDVAEPELRAAHPGVDAPALLGRLKEAGLLAPA